MYACKSLNIQGILCIELYAQKCERNSIRGRRIFIGFPDKFAKPAFYAGPVSLDFTGGQPPRCPPNVQISAVIATQLRNACIIQVISTHTLELQETQIRQIGRAKVHS